MHRIRKLLKGMQERLDTLLGRESFATAYAAAKPTGGTFVSKLFALVPVVLVLRRLPGGVREIDPTLRELLARACYYDELQKRLVVLACYSATHMKKTPHISVPTVPLDPKVTAAVVLRSIISPSLLFDDDEHTSPRACAAASKLGYRQHLLQF